MTLGTWLFTWFKGEEVGRDEFGNRYYLERGRRRHGHRRRWVMYSGEPEASKVPPRWHAWLHRMVDELPSESAVRKWPWEKEHIPNPTGTPEAYRPSGHVLKGGRRAKATGDYEPWRP